jgi:DNA-binding beta-propeller fold protein YncE
MGSTNTVVESIPVGEFANPRGIAFNPNNNYMYVTNGGFSTVSVIATTTPIQTTINSATDGNGNPVDNGGSTVSTSITFQVTATSDSNPVAGFECSLEVHSLDVLTLILPQLIMITWKLDRSIHLK